MAVFFGKMKDMEYVNNFTCPGGNGLNYFGGMQQGDYVFLRVDGEKTPDGRSISHTHRLWKFNRAELDQNNKGVAYFDLVFEFNPISVSDFSTLDLFKINRNLVVLTLKQTRVGFIKLDLVNEQEFYKLIANQQKFNQYISDRQHYRQIVLRKSLNEISEKATDVQIYKENDSFKIYSAPNHFAYDLVSECKPERLKQIEQVESDNIPKRILATARKAYRWLINDGKGSISIQNIWDLFCSNVSIKKIIDSIESEQVDNGEPSYYLIVAIPDQFSFEKLEEGETQDFTYKNENGNYRKIPKNFKNAKQGDKVLCYDARPTLKIVALGEIVSNQSDKYISVKKIHSLEKYIDYKDFFNLPIMKESEYAKVPQGTIFELTKEQYDAILGLLSDEDKKVIENAPLEIGYNKIYYGLPGCGKSHKIKEDFKGKRLFRTTFYQDYSYTDFVGQIMPTAQINEKGERTLTYVFKEGPFFKALKEAYQNPSENIYLDIEELNRGNAPSIFGDLFQLLDRKPDGESEYPVDCDLITSNLGFPLTKHDGKVYIPSNLIILATMNTSDQNVFTLDTAFKRRWLFEEIRNSSYPEGFVPGTDVKWQDFVEIINDEIVNLQTSFSSSEDKRIGSYFVTENELSEDSAYQDEETVNRFAYKVLEYLWDYVVRFNRDKLFKPEYKTLSQLIDGFKAVQLNIFVDSIKFPNEQ